MAGIQLPLHFPTEVPIRSNITATKNSIEDVIANHKVENVNTKTLGFNKLENEAYLSLQEKVDAKSEITNGPLSKSFGVRKPKSL